MNLASILAAIRGSKKRTDLSSIIHAAENRDSKLSNIEGAKERDRLWAKFEKQGIKVGDMVFIHTGPKIIEKKGKQPRQIYMGGTHREIWGEALTVTRIKVRSKEICVRVSGGTEDYLLSAGTIDKFKLSLTPSAAALASGLQKRMIHRRWLFNGNYVDSEVFTGPNGSRVEVDCDLLYTKRKKK